MTIDTRNARNTMQAELNKYLIGPDDEQEVLTEVPTDFYHVGILYPRNTQTEPENHDLADAANSRGEESSGDTDVFDLANSQNQSAMGMTFFVPKDTPQLNVSVSWGEYHKSKAVDESDNSPYSWNRTPREKNLTLDLAEKISEQNLGRLTLIVRTTTSDDLRAVTLSLVHAKANNGSNWAEEAAYQVQLNAALPSGEFLPAPSSHSARQDEEHANHELLYRKQLCYAVGHGVAVAWEVSPVTELKADWLPQVEVSKASPDIMSDAKCLDMLWLSECEDVTSMVEALEELTSSYSLWIEQQKTVLEAELAEESESRRTLLLQAGHENLAVAQEQLDRINAGIYWLEDNPDAFDAFRFANETIAIALKWRLQKTDDTFRPRWRAFQLGFILASMQGAADHDHPDRKIVDLIWFPTGGGKTEAYLGLTALVLFYRMLLSEEPSEMQGVSVLTRYTLRLLTLQQFERTASMLCAANIVKDSLEEFYTWPDFTLGLFVGSAATPNALVDAEKIRKNTSDAETDCTTLPLTRCPVCLSELSTQDQVIDKLSKKLITRCRDHKCEANRGDDGICIAVVDEQIYAHPPSVVIGTVDKFAMMAWKPEVARLFGQGNSCRPPDMIIQDELHLIGDALGTMVALYETAIDALTSREGSPIKIIGSTATIRRAAQQVRKIYNRDVLQFPASGIDAEDSFFYQKDNKNPGRKYIGVMAQGRSPKHSLIWLAGILSQSSTLLSEPVRDPFHTLLLYFNSLRELGGALVLMEDEVRKYIDSIAENEETRRQIVQICELTSRLRADELRELLQEMNIPWKPADSDRNEEPVDALLSTNMISVGVDIDRLGMMIMNGQPKTTAEYIQATSRVGRQPGSAGLVVTLYNWTRPRDRSHYERFQDYHQSFYRHVESTSVTPFAPRARDRALHAVMVALFRCLASDIDVNDPRSADSPEGEQLLNRISEIILSRVDSIHRDDPNLSQLHAHVEDHIEEIKRAWKKRLLAVEDNWGKMNRFGKSGLLVSPDYKNFDEDDPAADMTWRTPTSMREVEQPVNIRLVKARVSEKEVN